MPIIDLEQLPLKTSGGASFQTICVEPVMMLRVLIPPHTRLPPHAHENFQMGYVLAGSCVMTIGGKRSTMSCGRAYTIPSQALHDLETDAEPLELLDIYYPPKGDRA